MKLYLDGKIRGWYSDGDGNGEIFLVDAKTEAEAHDLIETLTLAKEQRWITNIFPSDFDVAEGVTPSGAEQVNGTIVIKPSAFPDGKEVEHVGKFTSSVSIWRWAISSVRSVSGHTFGRG